MIKIINVVFIERLPHDYIKAKQNIFNKFIDIVQFIQIM